MGKELQEYRQFMKKEEMHKALNSLSGILSGVAADGAVSEDESNEIQNWYAIHAHLMNVHPFSEILTALDMAFADTVLDIEEIHGALWLCQRFLDEQNEKLYFDCITSQIQQLEGMLHGIISDGEISDDEITSLSTWLNENDHLCGVYPFDEVYSLLLAAKEDGKVSNDERNMLRAFFSTFVDTSISYNIHENDVADLQKQYSIGGICAICPEIEIEGKTFCFTGASKKATRMEIAEIVCSKGGKYHDTVTAKTDYLIVGADGNPCWAFSCYGRKVEKAVELRKKGKPIVIVHEYDFWDEIDG